MPAELAKLPSVRPEVFSRKNRLFVKKIQLQTIFRLYTKNVRKNEKDYLTGVSNRQSTCPDDRSNEKNVFAGITVYFFELRLKLF